MNESTWHGSHVSTPILRSPLSNHHSISANGRFFGCNELIADMPPAIPPHHSFSPIPPVSHYEEFSTVKLPAIHEKVDAVNKSTVPGSQSHSLFDTLMTHSRETARTQRDVMASIICWQCQTKLLVATKCSICSRACCKFKCTRTCETCTAAVCSLCSEMDYSLQFDRLLCVNCVQCCRDQNAMEL